MKGDPWKGERDKKAASSKHKKKKKKKKKRRHARSSRNAGRGTYRQGPTACLLKAAQSFYSENNEGLVPKFP